MSKYVCATCGVDAAMCRCKVEAKMTTQRVWEFDRYVRGELKAEGIRISRATSEGQARRMAAELADHGDVLVMRGEPQVDALLRELGRHIFGGRWLDHASDCRLGIGEEPCTCGLSAWLAQFRLLHEPRGECKDGGKTREERPLPHPDWRSGKSGDGGDK